MTNGGKKYFHFRGQTTTFDHKLVVEQCSYIKHDHMRCKKMVEIGLDMCWIHLLQHKHLRIKESKINGAGLGLWAMDPKRPPNAIIFKEGDEICKYNGEVINDHQRYQRYGDNTGPYVTRLTGNDNDLQNRTFEDAAFQRGIGSLINHIGQGNRQNAAIKTRCTINTNHIPETYIKALKPIKNNQEILTTYGTNYLLNVQNVTSGTNNRIIQI